MFHKRIICLFCLLSRSLGIRQGAKSEPNLIVSKVQNVEVAGDLQIPYQAGLLDKNGDKFPFCGGSLISRHYVLTAAHCVADHGEDVKTPDNIYIILGHADLNDNCSVRHFVSEIVIHPDYYMDHEWNNHNDLALLRLHKSVKTSIKALCLPKDDKNRFAGVSLKISGYGIYNSILERSENLRMGRFIAMDETSCKNLHNGANNKHLCFVSDYQDLCRGESGGPVVAEVDGKNVLVGIMSYGNECSMSRVVHVFSARVSSYLSWIIANSDYRRENEDDCDEASNAVEYKSGILGLNLGLIGGLSITVLLLASLLVYQWFRNRRNANNKTQIKNKRSEKAVSMRMLKSEPYEVVEIQTEDQILHEPFEEIVLGREDPYEEIVSEDERASQKTQDPSYFFQYYPPQSDDSYNFEYYQPKHDEELH